MTVVSFLAMKCVQGSDDAEQIAHRFDR